MFRKILRISNCKSFAGVYPRIQKYSSFTARDIFTETSDEVGTLANRFAKHIALECRKEAPLVPTSIRYSDFFPVTENKSFQRELIHLPPEQIAALVTFAFTYRPSADPKKFAMVLNEIDRLAMENIHNMECDVILNILYSYLFLIPNWIMRTDFYRKAIWRLVQDDLVSEMTKEKLVQIAYFIGLSKKENRPGEKTSILLEKLYNNNLSEHVSSMSMVDLAIICNAAYKTATVVNIPAYNDRLCEVVMKMPEHDIDDELLITFLKAMRLQRIKSKTTCEYLDRLCENPTELEKLQTAGLAHIFAFFAENLWNNIESIETLMGEFVKRLGGKPENQFHVLRIPSIRVKDMATFLWACAQLNTPPSTETLNGIEQFLISKTRAVQMRYFPDQLVDCTLSLWMLGQKSIPLLDHCVKLKIQDGLYQKNKSLQPKVDSRFTVLLSAAIIDKPEWAAKQKHIPIAFHQSAIAPPYLLKSRPDLTELAKEIALLNDINKVQFTCPIYGINIPSLQITMGDKLLFIELATKEQLLKFTDYPNALLNLKTRLLIDLGYQTILLYPDELDVNVSLLRTYLSELKLEKDVDERTIEEIEESDEVTKPILSEKIVKKKYIKSYAIAPEVVNEIKAKEKLAESTDSDIVKTYNN